MSAEQYLQDFVQTRIPSDRTLDEFYKAAGNQKKELLQLANEIVDLQVSEALSATSTQTKAYDELAAERAKIVANLDLPDSQTDRVERERRLDNIQREMESHTQAGRGNEARITEKMSELEQLTDSVIERL